MQSTDECCMLLIVLFPTESWELRLQWNFDPDYWVEPNRMWCLLLTNHPICNQAHMHALPPCACALVVVHFTPLVVPLKHLSVCPYF